MPFVSVTRLRLRSVWHVFRFFRHAIPSKIQAQKAPGVLQVNTFNGGGLVFCTRTVWKDQASMRAYLLSGAHLKAMKVLQDIVCDASVAHWEQETEELPSLAEMHKRLVEIGRLTKIKHPSEEHKAGRIPPFPGQ